MLSGRKILLGVCGSIAAYKSAYLTRLLLKANAEVRIIMTDAAHDFISALTLATLSKHDVLSSLSKGDSWNSHVELGLWADAFVIAPASANSIAKFANGICDNLLTATYLSAKSPVYIAPAMDLDMWKHPATQRNIKELKSFGNFIIPVSYGELASGLIGDGRMSEPEDILTCLQDNFSNQKKKGERNKLSGKKILITAGPTVEPIDPVRYISNHSTGKMGIALAEELTKLGAKVTLIKGPTSLQPSSEDIRVVLVNTAHEMYEAAITNFKKADVAILAAAVADFTPSQVASKKIKKSSAGLSLQLEKTQDILLELSKNKRKNQILVGFALETDDEVSNATKKLKEKNLDMIVLNSLRDKGAGFGHDTNKIIILDRQGHQKKFPLKSKTDVAKDIIFEIINLINAD